MSIRETEGFVKVLTDTESGRMLAMHVVGPTPVT